MEQEIAQRKKERADLKRKSSEMLESIQIEVFKTPLKNTKCQSHNPLTNTEKSLAYLHSKVSSVPSKIAVALKRSSNSVNDFIKRVNYTGTFEPQNSKKGRWKKGEVKLNERQKTLLKRWLEKNEVRSVRQCTTRLNTIRNLPYASYKSVNTYLKRIGGFVRPKLKSIVSATNKEKRIEFCTKFKDFNFRRVIFTDESSFQLNANNQKSFRFKGKPPPTTTKFNPNYNVMVWGGISCQGKTSLHFIQGKVNAEYYKGIIAEKKEEIERMFRNRGKWLFQHDNAPSHRPSAVRQFIQQELGCELLPHPPQSPDLNPIELIWAIMKTKVEATHPKNKGQLKNAIEAAWKSITVDHIKKCIANLPSKMEKIIKCNGDLI